LLVFRILHFLKRMCEDTEKGRKTDLMAIPWKGCNSSIPKFSKRSLKVISSSYKAEKGSSSGRLE